MRKLKWKDISENTTIPKEERKIWVNIDVPAEKTKTGRSYRVAAPIAKFLEHIRVLTKYKKIEDFIFAEALFDLEGQDHFADLAAEGSFWTQQQALDRLLGDRRCALLDAASAQIGHGCSEDRRVVEASMLKA